MRILSSFTSASTTRIFPRPPAPSDGPGVLVCFFLAGLPSEPEFALFSAAARWGIRLTWFLGILGWWPLECWLKFQFQVVFLRIVWTRTLMAHWWWRLRREQEWKKCKMFDICIKRNIEWKIVDFELPAICSIGHLSMVLDMIAFGNWTC